MSETTMTGNITIPGEDITVLKKYLSPPELQRVVSKFVLLKPSENIIVEFFRVTDKTKIDYQPTNTVYPLYREFCREKGIPATSQIDFSRQAVKYTRYAIVDKTIRCVKYRLFAPLPGNAVEK